MTEVATNFNVISVPLTWAGMTRQLADGRTMWTCGGCSRPDVCAETGRCQRARPEDFEQGRII